MIFSYLYMNIEWRLATFERCKCLTFMKYLHDMPSISKDSDKNSSRISILVAEQNESQIIKHKPMPHELFEPSQHKLQTVVQRYTAMRVLSHLNACGSCSNTKHDRKQIPITRVSCDLMKLRCMGAKRQLNRCCTQQPRPNGVWY